MPVASDWGFDFRRAIQMQPMNKAVKPVFAGVACLTVALHCFPPSFVCGWLFERHLLQASAFLQFPIHA